MLVFDIPRSSGGVVWPCRTADKRPRVWVCNEYVNLFVCKHNCVLSLTQWGVCELVMKIGATPTKITFTVRILEPIFFIYFNWCELIRLGLCSGTILFPCVDTLFSRRVSAGLLKQEQIASPSTLSSCLLYF